MNLALEIDKKRLEIRQKTQIKLRQKRKQERKLCLTLKIIKQKLEIKWNYIKTNNKIKFNVKNE